MKVNRLFTWPAGPFDYPDKTLWLVDVIRRPQGEIGQFKEACQHKLVSPGGGKAWMPKEGASIYIPMSQVRAK
jgi:hypothetical protein